MLLQAASSPKGRGFEGTVRVLHRHRFIVAFSDTDMAGIVHFSAFFRYMEAAEHAFLRSVGLSVVMDLGPERVGWPRVHAEADYLAPLRFEDEVEATLLLRERREKAVVYDFQFRRLQPLPEVDVARGSLTVVSTRWEEGRMRAVPIPEAFARALDGGTETQERE